MASRSLPQRCPSGVVEPLLEVGKAGAKEATAKDD